MSDSALDYDDIRSLERPFDLAAWSTTDVQLPEPWAFPVPRDTDGTLCVLAVNVYPP